MRGNGEKMNGMEKKEVRSSWDWVNEVEEETRSTENRNEEKVKKKKKI